MLWAAANQQSCLDRHAWDSCSASGVSRAGAGNIASCQDLQQKGSTDTLSSLKHCCSPWKLAGVLVSCICSHPLICSCITSDDNSSKCTLEMMALRTALSRCNPYIQKARPSWYRDFSPTYMTSFKRIMFRVIQTLDPILGTQEKATLPAQCPSPEPALENLLCQDRNTTLMCRWARDTEGDPNTVSIWPLAAGLTLFVVADAGPAKQHGPFHRCICCLLSCLRGIDLTPFVLVRQQLACMTQNMSVSDAQAACAQVLCDQLSLCRAPNQLLPDISPWHQMLLLDQECVV